MTAMQAPVLEIDHKAMKVIVRGEWRPLTIGRFRLLCLFLDREGEMLSHQEIVETAAGYAYPYGADQAAANSRNLVFRLRRQLVGAGIRFVPLRGVGFRLEREER